MRNLVVKFVKKGRTLSGGRTRLVSRLDYCSKRTDRQSRKKGVAEANCRSMTKRMRL